MRATFGSIGAGLAGVLDTVHRMRRLVNESLALPRVRQAAAGIVRGTGTDAEAQAAAIRDWLERHTGFLRDPYGVEALHEPELMVATIAAGERLEVDCDDVAMLGAALGMAVGLPARFVLVGRTAGDFEHVFTELGDPFRPGTWWELDITRAAQPDPAYQFYRTVEV